MGQDKVTDDKMKLAESFNQAGAELVALPAPSTSLHNPNIAPIIRDSLSQNNTVYFGEWHDDVNSKFFADNPEVFREAKAQNADKLFAEIDSSSAPLYQAYFDNKISEDKFKEQLLAQNSKDSFTITSGDTAQATTEQFFAMAKTAKTEGVRILPSDFRGLNPNFKNNLPVNYTSSAFGIPDVQGIDDSVQRQTKLSLEEYKNMYAQNGEPDIPVTMSQQNNFKYLHESRLYALPEDEKKQFEKDLNERKKKFREDENPDNLNYQNDLQLNYYKMVVNPGEKTLFMGGRDHIRQDRNMSQLLEENGYGKTTSVELLSDGGVLHDKALETAGIKVPNAEFAKPFDYKVQTQTGEIMKSDGQVIDKPLPQTTSSSPLWVQQPIAPQPSS